MPTTYEHSPDLEEAVQAARDKWHPVLKQCGVTVAVLLAADIDDETGEISRCLKKDGYPVAAMISITPAKQRALEVADALMVIDEAAWNDLSQDEQIALLDHELTHLQVKAADKGLVGLTDKGKIDRSQKLDDHRRPVLKLRKHDWQLGGFREVARRHREKAPEVVAVRVHQDELGQYAWDFDLIGAAKELADLGGTEIRSTIDGKTTTVDLREGAAAH